MKHVLKFAAAALIIFAGCSTVILKPVDFAWPVESVLDVDQNGNVDLKRYSLTFDTKELFLDETGDSSGYMNKELRIIRDAKGYYFMVSNNFKNVYVFNSKDGTFSLNNKIEISDSAGIKSPAFNQRQPYIQLVYNDNKKVYLDNNGIKEDEK